MSSLTTLEERAGLNDVMRLFPGQESWRWGFADGCVRQVSTCGSVRGLAGGPGGVWFVVHVGERTETIWLLNCRSEMTMIRPRLRDSCGPLRCRSVGGYSIVEYLVARGIRGAGA